MTALPCGNHDKLQSKCQIGWGSIHLNCSRFSLWLCLDSLSSRDTLIPSAVHMKWINLNEIAFLQVKNLNFRQRLSLLASLLSLHMFTESPFVSDVALPWIKPPLLILLPAVYSTWVHFNCSSVTQLPMSPERRLNNANNQPFQPQQNIIV